MPVSVEVLDGGVVRDELDLSKKATYSLGRNGGFCDLVIDDPLLSRKHAVFQHREGGGLYIFDLGSTHGTFLNGKRVAAGQFVLLRNGDFLRFGPKEDRHFIVKIVSVNQTDNDHQSDTVENVQSSSESQTYNSEKAAMEAYLQKQQNKSYRELYEELLERTRDPEKKKKQVKRPTYNPNEVTWGMVDEDVVYGDHVEEEILRTDILRMLPKLTPKHLSKIEAFEKQQRKMHLLTVDYNKIHDMEMQGSKLADNQIAVKNEISERMNKLASELSMAEDKLKQMFGLEDNNRSRSL